ncbi:MAG TPA: DUF308 domain-containing protein [Candidatus Monoglobus merdigallinarum]|uniref:DUF308 domain-containing protein n=1 Tax=Candidatus Monoglobus merdigallinarum TaxID=2838698 RepID=A0A9D1PQC1_9FIRM|nr:DUF308 domain-containing protein [Candidatus Monoglobus merdigallinarum]
MKTFSIGMGVIFAVLGIICLIIPQLTIRFLTYAIAAIIFIAGIFLIVSFFTKQHTVLGTPSGWTLFYGIVSAVLGIVLFFNPYIGDFVMAILLGSWLVISSISNIVSALRLKSSGLPWGIPMIFSVLSLIIGILTILHPILTIFAIGIYVGVSLIIEGINFIIFGSKL